LFSYNDTSDVWTESAYIKASNTGASDEFGYSLAFSADATVLAIGAYQESNPATGVTTDGTNGSETPNISGATSSGAVYLFNKSGGTWSQIAYVKASNTTARDNFGRSLDLSSDGHTLAVGAQEEENGAVGITNGSTNTESGKVVDSGAVYLFSDSSGNWIQTAYIKASNTGTSDRFGHSVSIDADGSTLAVGAYLEDNSATGVITDDSEGLGDIGTEADSGAVYLFDNDGVNWTQTAYIKASNTNAGDGFGYDVVLSSDGNTLAVGAFSEDSSLTGITTDGSETSAATTEAESGAVYLFTNDGVSWAQTSYVKASNTEAGDHFGASLALSNDVEILAIGAYGEANSATGIITNGSESATTGTGDVGTATNSGAVYIF
jgi:hypothetical protein